MHMQPSVPLVDVNDPRYVAAAGVLTTMTPEMLSYVASGLPARSPQGSTYTLSYSDPSLGNKRSPKPIVDYSAGRIAENYVYGDDLERSCSLKNRCNRMPPQHSEPDVVLVAPDEVCVICGHAWVSEESVAQYLAEMQQSSEGELTASDVEELEEVLLVCEGCEGSYHLICTGMSCVPEGNWYCQFCSEA